MDSAALAIWEMTEQNDYHQEKKVLTNAGNNV